MSTWRGVMHIIVDKYVDFIVKRTTYTHYTQLNLQMY